MYNFIMDTRILQDTIAQHSRNPHVRCRPQDIKGHLRVFCRIRPLNEKVPSGRVYVGV